MASEPDGSITNWLGALKGGDPAAAGALWDRYFARLVHLARARLRAARSHNAVEDEEDAALSAFDSFCAGAMGGRFEGVEDRDGLWRLLVVIPARKAVDQIERQGRRKRGGGRRVTSLYAHDGTSADPSRPSGFDRVADPAPSPEFLAMIHEECERLLGSLGDEQLRLVAVRRMEGASIDEIARELGLGRRTIVRRLETIRARWLGKEQGEGG